jgi:hypothetical protein
MEGKNVVETRQRVEDLFAPLGDAAGNQIFIAAGGTMDIPAQPSVLGPGPAALGREIDGYDVVSFYGLSDQPFTIGIYEAVECEGPYVLAQTLTSAVVGGFSRVSVRIPSNAKFMRIVVTNTGGAPQTVFSFRGFGIPIATAGA